MDQSITAPARLRRLFPYILAADSTADIARATGLRPHTVDEYISELLLCYDCRSRAQLALRLRDETGEKDG